MKRLLLAVSALFVTSALFAQPIPSVFPPSNAGPPSWIQGGLWSQPWDNVSQGTVAQDFPDFPTFSTYEFNDMRVPGPGWNITSVRGVGFNSASSNRGLNEDVRLLISSNANFANPGTIYALVSGKSVLDAGLDTLIFDEFSLSLPRGDYWASMWVRRPFGGGGGQWFWARTLPIRLGEHIFHNPGGGFGFGTAPVPGTTVFGTAADQNINVAGTLGEPSGDVNGDGIVDDSDLAMVLEAFGNDCDGCAEDVNGDGIVDDSDLATVLTEFGQEKMKCEVSAFNVPTNRSGCVNEDAGGGRRKAGERFNMNADFTGKCECCEYRQYVKGFFKFNGVNLVHRLCGENLDENNYREDGFEQGTDCHRYGYRADAWGQASNDIYQAPNRATGCEYRGFDFPGITANAGNTYEVNLSFRGEIVDVCNGNKVVRTTTWTVKCSGTLSAEEEPISQRTIETRLDGRDVTVQLKSMDDGRLIAVVSIPNGDGSLPLFSNDIDLSIGNLKLNSKTEGRLIETQIFVSSSSHSIYEFSLPANMRGKAMKMNLSVRGETVGMIVTP
ncbi:MAG: hypothetical protein HUU60_06215 [Armatimonadetes bacterium]|nr:hypothetical protein [Armatimonadota bacterium]